MLWVCVWGASPPHRLFVQTTAIISSHTTPSGPDLLKQGRGVQLLQLAAYTAALEAGFLACGGIACRHLSRRLVWCSYCRSATVRGCGPGFDWCRACRVWSLGDAEGTAWPV